MVRKKKQDSIFPAQTKHTSEVLAKTTDEEEIFPLRAQDWSSPATIFFWMALNATTAPEEKLRKAFESAIKMRKMPTRKAAD